MKKVSTNLAPLMLGAIGVVYGDIGTSPLYALKTCFIHTNLPITELNVIGIISLFIWVLLLVVTLKYVYLVMNADDDGEGGIVALSLACQKLKLTKSPMQFKFLVYLGIIGAALFFSDGIITPAISVLSALEGLEVLFQESTNHIMLLSILLLSILFWIQKTGSGLIGSLFGPIMLVWFVTIGLLGLHHIVLTPDILKAFNPYYAVEFMLYNKNASFLTIGGVFLVVTGAEALYADMGHFGKKSIQLSWNFFVFPSLLLNYLGQGSLLLRQPEMISNPFYNLVNGAAIYPLIVLSTIATIIASQSIISGVFSISSQAIRLNYLPKLKVLHTSDNQAGQVYVPFVNLILYLLTICAILKFQNSANLASAYGLSVSGVMLITTILVLFIAYYQWRLSSIKLILTFMPLLFLDSIFLIVNLTKIFEGAWYTITVTVVVSIIMWKTLLRNHKEF